MSDLKPKFEETFLRQAEKTDLVVSREVNMSDFFASSLESLTTSSGFTSSRFVTFRPEQKFIWDH